MLIKEVDFKTVANLFIPQTIDTSFTHLGDEVVGGIKDDDNKWNIKGHNNRIIHIDKEILGLFANLYDEEGTHYLEARLPALHAVELINVLEKFAKYPKKLSNIKGEYHIIQLRCGMKQMHNQMEQLTEIQYL